MNTLNWQSKLFQQLTNIELYELLKFRVDIFVVEQNCSYSELDDKDMHVATRHLTAQHDSKLFAYARLLPPGLSYSEASIGRFSVETSARHQGIGTLLMEKCLAETLSIWPKYNIKISAQEYTQGFYEKFGFRKISDPYLEDNIPHIAMLKDYS